MDKLPEIYETQGGKVVLLENSLELMRRFGSPALRITTDGDIELLIISDEETLIWVPISDLELVRNGSIN